MINEDLTDTCRLKHTNNSDTEHYISPVSASINNIRLLPTIKAQVLMHTHTLVHTLVGEAVLRGARLGSLNRVSVSSPHIDSLLPPP